MLVRLLYASRIVTPPLTPETLDAILAVSRQRNVVAGITGILCYTPELFLQVLEGGRGPVSALYNRIAADPRHTSVEILSFEEICERRFPNWTMGQVNVGKVNPATLLKYSEQVSIDPFRVGGRASMALLDELIATAAIVGR